MNRRKNTIEPFFANEITVNDETIVLFNFADGKNYIYIAPSNSAM
jgi:hypothetical protein